MCCPVCRLEMGRRGGNLRAPDELRNLVNEVGNLCQLLTTRQAGCYVTQACQVLAEHHGANEAVVTWCVHDALLVLNGPSCGGHTLCKADKDLHNRRHMLASSDLQQ